MSNTTLIMCSPTVARHDVQENAIGTHRFVICRTCGSIEAVRVSLVKPVSFVKRDRTAAYITSVR